MQNIGIIAEFNPFHLGHEHLIKTAKQSGNGVICIMSGNFVQRGDTAIIPKHERAKAAVMCGADLVIEMPAAFSLATAQKFAEKGIGILNDLKVVNKLYFGSECGDIKKLCSVSDILLSDEFEKRIKDKINCGKTYAKIRQEVLAELCGDAGDILENPNDILGIEYITALKKSKSKIEPFCIKRLGAMHNQKADGITASAQEIREKIKLGDYDFAKKYMPEKSFEILKSSPVSDITVLENSILCSLREKRIKGELESAPDISEGLANRFKTAVESSCSLNELYESIKTKRYTLSRIRRLVLNTYLSMDKSYFKAKIPYIRVLALSKTGEQILSDISKKTKLPIITASSDFSKLGGFAKQVFDNEQICTDIYSLSLSRKDKCGNEYYKRIFKGED